MRKITLGSLIVAMLAVTPSVASADITAFLGTNTSTDRLTTGFGIGAGLIIVGFEFEYGQTRQDEEELSPSLRTFMFNGLVQTPVPIGGMQFYATAGGGVYRETLLDDSETNVGINVGGGVKMNLAGPLRLRFDYRVFTLQGNPRHSKPQRLYAGLNLKF